MHAVDAAICEEVQDSKESLQAIEAQPLLHVVPGPAGAELQPLTGGGILLAAFLKLATKTKIYHRIQ